MSGFNLTQHVKCLTHIHGGTLDHFITLSDSSIATGAVSINDCITDHMYMITKLNIPPHHDNVPSPISYRKCNRINLDALKFDLQSSDLMLNPCLTSPGDLYDQYHATLTQLLDKHAPLCTKQKKRSCEPWITNDFIKAKQTKRYLERIWRRTKSVIDRSRFRQQVNKCNRILNNSKNKFYSDIISEHKDNPKKLWNHIHSVLLPKSKPPLPCDPNLADKFCDFFIDKIAKIRSSFSSPSIPAEESGYQPPSLSTFVSVSEHDVKKIILRSPSKSCLLDPWPTFLVKDCLNILITPITKLINLSLSQGIFPNKFKSAIITPILKKKSLDHSVLKNYRPVSGLNFVSKIIERVVSSQINRHLSANDLNNVHQSAYKTGHSTETALLKIKSDIHLNLSKNMPVALVLLDSSAAFDTLDHKQLLNSLS